MRQQRDTWNKIYALLVDGNPTEIELAGTSKTSAYTMLEHEWSITYPDTPLPARRRCKLEYIESTRNC